MNAPLITRRRFLRTVAASTVVTCLGCSGWSQDAATTFVLDLVNRVAVPDPLRIGEVYLRQGGERPDARELLARIFPGDDGLKPAERLVADFGHRVRDDFENHRTVRVDGWILSQTEAQFCALLSLGHSSRPI